MKDRVLKLLDRYQEVENFLGQPDVLLDQKKYRELTQEHSYLSQVKESWEKLESAKKNHFDALELLKSETDLELISLVKEEITQLETHIPLYTLEMENLLVPPDPRDSGTVIVEIRAGTGGEEAALFVGDCVRMYKAYADKKGWRTETLSASSSDRGGFKEYIMVISGTNVFRLLQHEAGTHRVQRVPDTETQGRVHTSAITVAILLEPSEEEKLVIDDRDLRIETYRASGAGGQHVNVTDSAVRITHVPTGTVVTCQDERSQHKNRDKAMRLLSARIVEEKRRKAHEEIANLRSSQVGTGDRSERIRTYNFPQNRLTDHRINLTLYKLEYVMDGDLDEITNPLVTYFYQLKLKGDEES